MHIFTYMLDWILTAIALFVSVGLLSLFYWVWKSDRKNKNRS